MTMTEERPMPPLSDPMDEAALLAVDDPRERLRLAAESARLAAERGDKAREKRNAAARQLAQTRKAVRVWKDTLGITRNLWTRIEQEPGGKVGTYKDPEGVARSASEETRRWDKVATDARRIRDETATGLMNGAYGPPARNAEVVALTGLTSARVAQLRTSY
jgi:hypothetical protein